MTLSDDVGRLCRELALVVDQYRAQLKARAETESDFKRERAKRILRARAQGEASSAAAAEVVADADDAISQLRLNALIADGIATATKEQIAALKERIGWGRSLYATQREQDRLHSTDRSVA
jgi:DNA invertase Pin-like site-specific DNA recombinase